MIQTVTSLILIPLLLFLEVGVGPLHGWAPSEKGGGSAVAILALDQTDAAPASVCPVCQLLRIGFLLSLILFLSCFLRRREEVSVHEIAFPARPIQFLVSRGPPWA